MKAEHPREPARFDLSPAKEWNQHNTATEITEGAEQGAEKVALSIDFLCVLWVLCGSMW